MRSFLDGFREQNQKGSTPIINSQVLENLVHRPIPSVAIRSLAILQEAERGLKKLGGMFNLNEPKFLGVSYSTNFDDVQFLGQVLVDEGLLAYRASGGTYAISSKGYLHLDANRARPVQSSQGFVAMWFSTEMRDAYEKGLQAGVLRAGYDPLRIDKVEHVNKIDDEIIRQINGSRFMVADFTGHRGGVYFEAGYAMGLSIPVFWTCRKSDMASLHFDIRQFNCIDWESPEELAKRLAVRIEAVMGPGPTKLV